MNRQTLAALLACSIGAAGAQAYVIEFRIVERRGDEDVVLPDHIIAVAPGTSHRYRLQLRVIPDGEDVRAGMIGWYQGSIITTGGINSRSGRPPDPNPHGGIPPFTNAPYLEGIPTNDPFVDLTGIYNVLGLYYAPWTCDPHDPPPIPPPPGEIGLGTFVSTHEITSIAGDESYAITWSGLVLPNVHWKVVGNACMSPDCGNPDDPSDDIPGYCQYTAFPAPPRDMSLTLVVRVCRAEWNGSGSVDSADFFDFLHDFFEVSADVNHDGTTNSQDFFDYLAAYFSGC